jgi:hypothetical protein
LVDLVEVVEKVVVQAAGAAAHHHQTSRQVVVDLVEMVMRTQAPFLVLAAAVVDVVEDILKELFALILDHQVEDGARVVEVVEVLVEMQFVVEVVLIMWY